MASNDSQPFVPKALPRPAELERKSHLMNRILVTGGAGYVGRELIHQLVAAADAELHIIDNLDSGEHRLAPMNQQAFTLHRADIRDRDAVERVMTEAAPTIIYHLAAIHYIPLCERNPGNAVNVNVAGTVNLLDTAPAGARFVLASTAAVYGPEDGAHVEDTSPIAPMDIYGWTKLHAEQFVRYYHQNGKVDGRIVRLFNVVGSGETNPHLAPAIIEQLDQNQTVVKLGNLFPHRDYIEVEDAAAGFQRIAQASGEDLLICNLGTGRTSSVGEMVSTIGDAAGIPITIEQDSSRIRAVDRPMLKASTDRLQALTGWTPQTPLIESMRRAWATRKEDRLTRAAQ